MKTISRALFIIPILTLSISSSVFATNEEERKSNAINFELPVIDWIHLESDYEFEQKNMSLDQFKGKVIYLDFWASWCVPCVKSMPILNRLRNEYHKNGFEIVAINVDEKYQEAINFLSIINVDYPILHDKHQEVTKLYKINVFPTGIIIDSKGKVIVVHQGFKPNDVNFIEAIVQKLIAEIN